MNVESFTFEPLVFEGLFQVKGVLRALLHTILFHRALGSSVRPKDCDCDVFEKIQYVKAENISLEKAVEEQCEKTYQSLKVSGKGKLQISFYTIRLVPSYFGIMSSEEKSYFEKWTIPIAVVEVLKGLKIKVPERKEQYFTDMMLKDRLNYIITMVNEKKDHLPPIGDVLCYPFDINISGGDSSMFNSLFDVLKAPPMLIK